MRTQTKLLSLVITLLVLTILASPVSALDPDVPDNSTFDYFIEYGPYSTDDYGPYEAGWHGPVYNASLQYPLTDYEIDIDIDFSGNNDYFNKMGKVLITGYSGDNEIWYISVADSESGARRLVINCFVGDSQLANALAPVAADWSGRLKFVHSTPDNWELWVGGNLLNNLTKPDIGSLTNITVDLLRYGTNSRIIPGMSCDRIAIYGVVDETLLPQPVEFRPYYTSQYGNVPLNGVQITVYTCDPVTLEPGDIVDIFTVDYGDIKPLPGGYYCIEASLNNYEQVYPISETRFSNVDGPAVALIPMEYVGGEDGSVEVRIVDVDTEEPLQKVRLRIYEALPNFQQGRLVRDVTVNSGDYISLPAGRYFAQASKSGYSQYFEVTNTRVVVDPPSPSILYIPMTSRDVVTPGEGSFLDQSIEAIANLFGVSFEIGKIILGMLLALGVGTATAKQLRGGAQEFGLGMLGGVVLGVLIGLLPIWVLVLLVLIVGLWVGHRYMSGGDS